MYENQYFFGYTYPETEYFGEHSRRMTNLIWDDWHAAGVRKIRSFLKLAFRYNPYRFEKACQRAFFYGNPSIDNIIEILERELEELPLSQSIDIEGQKLFDF